MPLEVIILPPAILVSLFFVYFLSFYDKDYNSNEIKYLQKVLNSDNWSSTSGTWCQTLEKKFSKTKEKNLN